MNSKDDFHQYLRYGLKNDLKQDVVDHLRKLTVAQTGDTYETSFFKEAVAKIVETIPYSCHGFVHHFASRMILQLTGDQHLPLKLSLEALMEVLESFKVDKDYSLHDAVADADIHDALNRQDKEEYNYDPKTCISAKEIRDMGIVLPENISDAAWVKRSAMALEPVATYGGVKYPIFSDGYWSFESRCRVTFREPFKEPQPTPSDAKSG